MSECKHQLIHTYSRIPKRDNNSQRNLRQEEKCKTHIHTTEVKREPNKTAENKCSFDKGSHRFCKSHSYLTMVRKERNFAAIVSEMGHSMPSSPRASKLKLFNTLAVFSQSISKDREIFIFSFFFLLKLVSTIFLSNFCFSLNDSPSKTTKNVFYLI